MIRKKIEGKISKKLPPPQKDLFWEGVKLSNVTKATFHLAWQIHTLVVLTDRVTNINIYVYLHLIFFFLNFEKIVDFGDYQKNFRMSNKILILEEKSLFKKKKKIRKNRRFWKKTFRGEKKFVLKKK